MRATICRQLQPRSKSLGLRYLVGSNVPTWAFTHCRVQGITCLDNILFKYSKGLHNNHELSPRTLIQRTMSSVADKPDVGIPSDAQSILDFWFGAAASPEYLQFRMVWFQSTDDFDASIAEKFGALIDEALAGGLKSWEANAISLVAKIIVLDQFTRNTRRGTPGAFAGDQEALRCAKLGVESGLFDGLNPTILQFALLPFMHSEDMDIQTRGAEVEWPKVPGYSSNTVLQREVETHRDMIRRFGRFPHRNAILGRTSTPEEVEYLATAHHYGQAAKTK